MIRPLAALIGLAVASALALKFAAVPYLWIFATAAVASVLWVLTARSESSKLVAVNLAAVLLALAGMEAYLAGTFSGDGPVVHPVEVEYDTEYFRPDDVLGYAPRDRVTVTATKGSPDKLSYRVTYTIDSLGLRRSPPDTRPGAPCILFFGGSFTFGEGVEDDESMPWVVGELTGYRTLNFGFYGYGPHQMLAALEAGLVAEKVADCPVEAVVYQAIAGHAARAAGKRAWDRDGPRYRLLPDGNVVRDGHFDDADTPPEGLLPLLGWRLKNQLRKSRIVAPVAPNDTSFDQDLLLFLAIVEASRRELAAAWPTAPFHLLLWDKPLTHAQLASIDASLGPAGITVHRVGDIVPQAQEGGDWRISYDGHPNARAHRAMAAYVAGRMLRTHPRTASESQIR